MSRKLRMYIDGEWLDSTSGNTRDIINPFNQEVIATAAEGNRTDAKAAIRAARAAFDSGTWSARPAPERGSWCLNSRA